MTQITYTLSLILITLTLFATDSFSCTTDDECYQIGKSDHKDGYLELPCTENGAPDYSGWCGSDEQKEQYNYYGINSIWEEKGGYEVSCENDSFRVHSVNENLLTACTTMQDDFNPVIDRLNDEFPEMGIYKTETWRTEGKPSTAVFISPEDVIEIPWSRKDLQTIDELIENIWEYINN